MVQICSSSRGDGFGNDAHHVAFDEVETEGYLFDAFFYAVYAFFGI